jgi:hypothetical protein
MRILTRQEHSMIIAALRLWQEMEEVPERVLEIATDMGTDKLMGSDDIDRLVMTLQEPHHAFFFQTGPTDHPIEETSPRAPTGLDTNPPNWRETSKTLLGILDRQTDVIAEQSRIIHELAIHPAVMSDPLVNFGQPMSKDDLSKLEEAIKKAYKNQPLGSKIKVSD